MSKLAEARPVVKPVKQELKHPVVSPSRSVSIFSSQAGSSIAELSRADVSKDPKRITAVSAQSRPSETVVEIHRRTIRQARGKSVILGIYIFFDLIYCLPRFLFLVPGLDADSDFWQPFVILCTGTTMGDRGKLDIDWSRAWIGVLSWTNYLLANVLLTYAVITLNLRFCYSYMTMKTASTILNFLGLLIYGYNCNKDARLYEYLVFILFHLPFQILGVKLCHTFIRSVKRAKRGEALLSTPATRLQNSKARLSQLPQKPPNAASPTNSVRSHRSTRAMSAGAGGSAGSGGSGGKRWYTV